MKTEKRVELLLALESLRDTSYLMGLVSQSCEFDIKTNVSLHKTVEKRTNYTYITASNILKSLKRIEESLGLIFEKEKVAWVPEHEQAEAQYNRIRTRIRDKKRHLKTKKEKGGLRK